MKTIKLIITIVSLATLALLTGCSGGGSSSGTSGNSKTSLKVVFANASSVSILPAGVTRVMLTVTPANSASVTPSPIDVTKMTTVSVPASGQPGLTDNETYTFRIDAYNSANSLIWFGSATAVMQPAPAVNSISIICNPYTAPTGTDSINIISVTPVTALAGQSTIFMIQTSYNLVSKTSGEINIGFNTSDATSYSLISSQKQIVSPGSGTVTFTVPVTPVNWGSSTPFFAYVNLSENPHPASWTPLASSSMPISLTAVATAVTTAGSSLSTVDQSAINNWFTTFTNFFATSLPSAQNPALLALFDSATFVQDGDNLDAFISQMTSDQTNVGLKLTTTTMTYLDSTATTAVIGFTTSTGVAGTWNFIKKNGSWLAQGNMQVASVDVTAEADMVGPSTFITGIVFNITYGANSKVNSAIATGPGLPASGITLVKMPNRNSLNVPGNQSTIGFYHSMSDATISAIPDNAQYTVKLLDSANNSLSTTTKTVPKRPLMMSELSSALFPVFTPQSITAAMAFSGGTLTVSWTLPSGFVPSNVNVEETLYDSTSTNSAWLDVDAVNPTTNSTATLTLQPISNTGVTFTVAHRGLGIWASDSITGRVFHTNNYQ